MAIKTANILDIARKSGLGKSTVARALSGTGSVSERTRKKVCLAADQLNYRPNMAARVLKSRENRVLGVVIPETNSREFLINPTVRQFRTVQNKRQITWQA